MITDLDYLIRLDAAMRAAEGAGFFNTKQALQEMLHQAKESRTYEAASEAEIAKYGSR